MAGTQGEFTALMERVRRGSNGAAEELVARYGAHILRVVRAKLSKKLRPKFDSADFVQSVWASFFGGGSDIQGFRQSDDLAAYLARMARNKVVDAFRRSVRSQKRNANRERSLESAVLAEKSDQFVAHQPTPSQEMVAREELDRRVKSQPVHYQQVLDLLRQGRNLAQIAEELGAHTETIRRAIRKLFPRGGP